MGDSNLPAYLSFRRRRRLGNFGTLQALYDDHLSGRPDPGSGLRSPAASHCRPAARSSRENKRDHLRVPPGSSGPRWFSVLFLRSRPKPRSGGIRASVPHALRRACSACCFSAVQPWRVTVSSFRIDGNECSKRSEQAHFHRRIGVLVPIATSGSARFRDSCDGSVPAIRFSPQIPKLGREARLSR